eukprot:8760450-Prorocentrum_lima.AAC.1
MAHTSAALPMFDGAMQRAMSRLFPGIGSNGLEQATLECAKGGLGWHRAVDLALPANLSALLITGPMVISM